ncbi:unnamed protein product [Arctia plantaginis]|uniref:Protein PAT1 homolog 1 n=1 Tax=Arctia plantaginis TaxID=874455 RepID=A0A8S1BFP4_ARCPL|nr:unnamed protein product [Arctia plantaginis]
MADSFFGFDTSVSNLNDDEGGGEPSEDEYDALNDETFGQGSDEFDWEVEHEQLAEQLESSRRHNSGIDDIAKTELEASLSQLVLDETDSPHLRSFSSSVWRHDPQTFPVPPAPLVSSLKNVCTVEELERQLRQKQQQQNFNNQNYFQPRFPPVILQRPPGLQAPVPLPFAPQQTMNHGLGQMNQPLNKLMNQMTHQNNISHNTPFFKNNQFQNNQMGPGNMMNQLTQNISVHQMAQNSQMMGQNNQMVGQNNQMVGQNNQMVGQNSQMVGQNSQMVGQSNQIVGQNINIQGQSLPMNALGQTNNMSQNMNHIGPNVNQMGRPMDQMNHSMNPISRNIDQMNQSMNHIAQNSNQMGQNVNQMGQNVNPINQINQMIPNGNPFPPNINQYQHMMGQGARMIVPPPGINMPRQNFNPNMGQYNTNYRTPSMPIKQDQPINPANLVQLIQNTHPMLQFNNMNSFHNANHHPMLQNNRNIYTNSQFNHPMFNQRHNGTFNNRHSMNGDDTNGSDGDEYAGLMTQREKQWLINIQMLQLNTGTPYIHDFYYTVFLERQASKEKEGIKEAHKANQQNHPFYSGGVKQESHTHRERHNSNRHNSTSEDSGTPRTYVPTQFENSLGKLQCGSVTAPRKIIDVEVVGNETAPSRMSRASSVASTTHPQEIPREMKRTKQLLLDIEALYLILLRLEELNDPLAISNALILKEREEKQKQLEAAQKEAENEQQDVSNLFLKNIESVQRRPKQDSPKNENIDKRQVVNLAVNQKPAPVKNLLDEDKDDLLNKMFAGLLHSDRLQQILSVRKGKALVARFVPRVCGGHLRLRTLWARVLRALPAAARRDAKGLAPLAPHYRSYIQNTTGWSPILESCSMLAEAFDPARTPYALTTSFTLSCVCALIEKASLLVNTPEATSNERQWSKFLKTLARALKNTNLVVARPLQPMSETKLMHHIKQLESRSTIEILQRGKSAEFADLTKTDVSEQLVKHLC